MHEVCVTGATGMIGGRIVESLLAKGYHVRVLTRREYYDSRVKVFRGSLEDIGTMEEFISGAISIFHCAAELFDESKMWQTNVEGTRLVAKLAQIHELKYLCYLSSAGVVGKTSLKLIREDSPCRPQSLYESTKFVAESIVSKGPNSLRTVILRPTNVIDSRHLGDLDLAVDGSIKSWIKAFIKGGECAHLVHVNDVANAAIFLLEKKGSSLPQKYFVSIDEDPDNTVARVWNIYREIISKEGNKNPKLMLSHAPTYLPYYLRILAGRYSNRGETRYSSQKLQLEGFEYSMGVRSAINEILNL
jgi:nucleoside-diphosphate-sugar epimerase